MAVQQTQYVSNLFVQHLRNQKIRFRVADHYFCANDLLQIPPKYKVIQSLTPRYFYHWEKTLKAQKEIQTIVERTLKSYNEIVQKNKNKRGSTTCWLHPDLLVTFARWVDRDLYEEALLLAATVSTLPLCTPPVRVQEDPYETTSIKMHPLITPQNFNLPKSEASLEDLAAQCEVCKTLSLQHPQQELPPFSQEEQRSCEELVNREIFEPTEEVAPAQDEPRDVSVDSLLNPTPVTFEPNVVDTLFPLQEAPTWQQYAFEDSVLLNRVKTITWCYDFLKANFGELPQDHQEYFRLAVLSVVRDSINEKRTPSQVVEEVTETTKEKKARKKRPTSDQEPPKKRFRKPEEP